MIPWTVAARFLCPWDFPGKNTGVGCHFLLQGIFLTQGFNLGLLHCRHILYCLSQGHVQKEINHLGVGHPSHTWSTNTIYSLCWTGHLDTLMETTGHPPSLPGNKPYSQVSPSRVCLTRIFSFPLPSGSQDASHSSPSELHNSSYRQISSTFSCNLEKWVKKYKITH